MKYGEIDSKYIDISDILYKYPSLLKDFKITDEMKDDISLVLQYYYRKMLLNIYLTARRLYIDMKKLKDISRNEIDKKEQENLYVAINRNSLALESYFDMEEAADIYETINLIDMHNEILNDLEMKSEDIDNITLYDIIYHHAVYKFWKRYGKEV